MAAPHWKPLLSPPPARPTPHSHCRSPGRHWMVRPSSGIAAQHSNQVFNRIAGAWISRGNGQESLISHRSPVLTGAGSCGAFMTAQDGISLRSPGFCNVNQLFDANLLQAGKLEVLKGPATVVFGSKRTARHHQCLEP